MDNQPRDETGAALSITEAAERLGVSRVKVRSLVKEGTLPAMTNPLDRRERLIPLSAIEGLEAQARFILPVEQHRTISTSPTSPSLPYAGLDSQHRAEDKT